MNTVEWEPTDKQTLMDWLFDTHTVVLRGSASNAPITSLAAMREHFKNFVDDNESALPTPSANPSPDSTKKYLEEAMRDIESRIQLLDKFFDEDEELPIETSFGVDLTQPDLDITERLRIGVGIEVNLGGKASVGRLNWINPNVSNLVLTLNDQAEPSVLSVRMFQRLLNNDRVRFLESEPIFERAVESLLISANQVH
jgi:hypothetical protein